MCIVNVYKCVSICVSVCVAGMAVYTGKDTKLALNSKIKSNKLSTVDM